MRFLLTVIMSAAILWACSLLWFVYSMPMQPVPATVKAEALVVLTGGQYRVEHGLDMLGKGAAPVLLVSGAGEHVTVNQILRHADWQTREAIVEQDGEVVLDHVARTTVTNADQSAAFFRERNIKSIRLITANYHMKRAMHEFQDASPDVEMVADPVFPDDFQRHNWWRHDNTRRLVFSEFYKYLAVLLRDSLRPKS